MNGERIFFVLLMNFFDRKTNFCFSAYIFKMDKKITRTDLTVLVIFCYYFYSFYFTSNSTCLNNLSEVLLIIFCTWRGVRSNSSASFSYTIPSNRRRFRMARSRSLKIHSSIRATSCERDKSKSFFTIYRRLFLRVAIPFDLLLFRFILRLTLTLAAIDYITIIPNKICVSSVIRMHFITLKIIR